jgi:3-oxoacyl-[acyl-carrier protein] reductase
MADIDGALCEKEAVNIPGAVAMETDVTNPASLAVAAAHLEQKFGRLDGLVNNAALLNESDAASVTAREMDRIMAANGTSVLHVSQAMLPLLRKSPHAAIVNTLSTQSFAAQPHGTAYGAAKGAALALTRCMAVDFAPLGIRVNGVAPGFINTRMAIMLDSNHEHETELFQSFYAGARKIPLARGGTPEDCAGAFIFLLSSLSSYITGQVITVDGGLMATY